MRAKFCLMCSLFVLVGCEPGKESLAADHCSALAEGLVWDMSSGMVDGYRHRGGVLEVTLVGDCCPRPLRDEYWAIQSSVVGAFLATCPATQSVEQFAQLAERRIRIIERCIYQPGHYDSAIALSNQRRAGQLQRLDVTNGLMQPELGLRPSQATPSQ